MILVNETFKPSSVVKVWRAVIDADRDTALAIDEAGSFGFSFRNGEKIESIALSEEAAMALYALLGHAMDHLGVEVRS